MTFSETKFKVLYFFGKDGTRVDSYDECYEILTKPLSNLESGILIPMTKNLLDDILKNKKLKIGDIIVRSTNYTIIEEN